MNPEMKFSEADMNEGFKMCVDTIIAKFSGNGVGRAPCAMYYGYNGKNSATKAVFDATNMAHKEIRSQLTKEVVIGIPSNTTNSFRVRSSSFLS